MAAPKKRARKPTARKPRTAVEGEEVAPLPEREKGPITKVKALKTGEYPTGVYRHVGDEFEFEFPVGGETLLLPHWMEDVEGEVETALAPAELNEP